jgi:O-antigen/teichoic acid export membrane protein
MIDLMRDVAFDGDEDSLSLSQSVGSGMRWVGLLFGLARIERYVLVIILARLLKPEDYGVMIVATLALNVTRLIQQLGIADALVWRRTNVQRAANSGFWMTVTAGSVLTTCLVVGARHIASFFDPRAKYVLWAVAPCLLLKATTIVPRALLHRSMDYRRHGIPEACGSTAGAIAAIVLAFAGKGFWALAAVPIVGTMVDTVLVYALSNWRPRFEFDRVLARELWRFGWQVQAGQVVYFFTQNIDYLIVGALTNSVTLGLYVWAFNLGANTFGDLNSLMLRVVYPAFVRIGDDPALVRDALLRSLRVLLTVIAPIVVLIAIAGGVLLPVVFGSQWQGAVGAVRVLLVLGLLDGVFFGLAGVVLRAAGHPGAESTMFAVRVALLVPALIIAVPHGLRYAALAHAAVALAVTPLYIVMLRRVAPITVNDLVRLAMAPMGALIFEATTLGVLLRFVLPPGPRLSSALILIVTGGLAALVWFAFPGRALTREVRAFISGSHGGFIATERAPACC